MDRGIFDHDQDHDYDYEESLCSLCPLWLVRYAERKGGQAGTEKTSRASATEPVMAAAATMRGLMRRVRPVGLP